MKCRLSDGFAAPGLVATASQQAGDRNILIESFPVDALTAPDQFPLVALFRSAVQGNHASGIASSRPSSSMTRNVSAVNVTSMAIGSDSRFKVRMPCLQKLGLVPFDQLADLLDFVGT